MKIWHLFWHFLSCAYIAPAVFKIKCQECWCEMSHSSHLWHFWQIEPPPFLGMAFQVFPFPLLSCSHPCLVHPWPNYHMKPQNILQESGVQYIWTNECHFMSRSGVLVSLWHTQNLNHTWMVIPTISFNYRELSELTLSLSPPTHWEMIMALEQVKLNGPTMLQASTAKTLSSEGPAKDISSPIVSFPKL